MDNKENKFNLKVVGLPSNAYSFKNNVFFNPKEFGEIKRLLKQNLNLEEYYIRIRDVVFSVKELPNVETGTLYFKNHRLHFYVKIIQGHALN
jgi:hypothetical protein